MEINPKTIHKMLQECPALRDLSLSRYEQILQATKDKASNWPQARYIYRADDLQFAIVQAYVTGFADAVVEGAKIELCEFESHISETAVICTKLKGHEGLHGSGLDGQFNG